MSKLMKTFMSVKDTGWHMFFNKFLLKLGIVTWNIALYLSLTIYFQADVHNKLCKIFYGA